MLVRSACVVPNGAKTVANEAKISEKNVSIILLQIGYAEMLLMRNRLNKKSSLAQMSFCT